MKKTVSFCHDDFFYFSFERATDNGWNPHECAFMHDLQNNNLSSILENFENPET